MRLSLVTALTIASLLVGSTTLSALAENGRNGNGHGNGGQGRPEHAQTVNAEQHQGNNGNNEGNDDNRLIAEPDRETNEVRPGLGCGDDNHEHSGAPGNPSVQCPDHGDDMDADD